MKFIKEEYIHNRIILNEEERDSLNSAYVIIKKIRSANLDLAGTVDGFLNETCNDILLGISKITNNYSNEYPKSKGEEKDVD